MFVLARSTSNGVTVTTSVVRDCSSYLNKEVQNCKRNYNHSEERSACDDDDHCWQGAEERSQEHQDGGGDDFVDHKDVLGKAVDDPPCRSGVIEGLRRVEFVLQQRHVKLPCCINASHCQGERGDEHKEAFQEKRRRVSQRACCSPFAFCLAALPSPLPAARRHCAHCCLHTVCPGGLPTLSSQHRCTATFFLQASTKHRLYNFPPTFLALLLQSSHILTQTELSQVYTSPAQTLLKASQHKSGAELRLSGSNLHYCLCFCWQFWATSNEHHGFPT